MPTETVGEERREKKRTATTRPRKRKPLGPPPRLRLPSRLRRDSPREPACGYRTRLKRTGYSVSQSVSSRCHAVCVERGKVESVVHCHDGMTCTVLHAVL
mmetsp:Transcript_14910/g.30122  ORF Transcript_14910/g.30122 Transcript_14910/m.30122 type:complete len:100 (+) Transcript_14910:142-441(+)